MKNALFIILVITLLVGILTCMLIVSFSTLNSSENALMSIILTLFSVLASWIISTSLNEKSHKLALEEVKEQHLSNLRTYALNAAEKVGNLSSELGRLSVYLQKELEDEDEDEVSNEELYLSAAERIESAIHIINTLKSVNDTYLSDWKGVIGEELDERFEEQQERENDLKELVEKAEYLIRSNTPSNASDQTEVQTLSKQISDLRKELNLTLNSVSGTFVRTSRTPVRVKKQDIKSTCPNCKNEIIYKQRPKETSFKFVDCKICNHKFFAKWTNENGFVLVEERNLRETYNCPTCSLPIEVELSNFPQKKVITTCTNCGAVSQLIRTVSKYNVHDLSNINDNNPERHGLEPEKKIVITEELLEKIRKELPTQPWPKGIHKTVAEILRLDTRTVSFHITELIKRGVFKPQIEGILYQPINRE